MNRLSGLIVPLTCAALFAGCAHYPVNEPLERIDTDSGYRLNNRELGPGNSDEVFVILALSGGGTRAAALDFGVMQQLDRVRFGEDGRSLLDEVDIISSSSGASLPAAYYGLFGKDAFFGNFKQDVLYRSIQSALQKRVINPLHWPRLMSGTFSRGDLIAEYLDEQVYDGRTFADMSPARPLIMLNATDIGIGASFSFTQGTFDLLCSDLTNYSVGRAVTASMAFTPAFTPITMKNYNDGRCGDTGHDWAYKAIEQGVEANPHVYAAAVDILSYKDIDKRPYIHLLDSGIADNIGIRTPTLAFQVRDAPASQVSRILDGTIQKLVFIIINARPKADFKPDLSPKPPGAITSVKASASRPLANYSYETINLIRRDIADARQRIALYHDQRTLCVEHADTMCKSKVEAEACHKEVRTSCFAEFGVSDDNYPQDLDIYLVHLSFDLIDDEQRREYFEKIPTKLQLPQDDIDALVGLGPELLHEEPEFRHLVMDLGADYNQ